MKNKKWMFILFIIIALSLHAIKPISNYAGLIALIFGIILSLSGKFYNPPQLNNYRKIVLNTSIIFFGFSLNIGQVMVVGANGIVISFISLVITISCGYALIKLLKIDKVTGELTTYGTAVCGGSAISAVSSVLNPKNKQIGMAMAIVFLLNGAALIIFPIIGHLLNMTEVQFGIFSALSIHDTSSVVGASSIYGPMALEVGTILKLTRTLWIIPIVLILGAINKTNNSKLPIPLFIIGFIITSIFSTILNSEFIVSLSVIGKYLLVVALFLVGYAIKLEDIKELGTKTILFGLLLWAVSIATGLMLAFMF